MTADEMFAIVNEERARRGLPHDNRQLSEVFVQTQAAWHAAAERIVEKVIADCNS